jgi:hypothetical protein
MKGGSKTVQNCCFFSNYLLLLISVAYISANQVLCISLRRTARDGTCYIGWQINTSNLFLTSLLQKPQEVE